MDKKFLIIANWKANASEIFNFKFLVSNNIEVAIAPAYPFISQIPENFSRAAQNVSSFPVGAYTGEVPAEILKNLNIKYCLIGHSERKRYLHETTNDTKLKYEALINQKIIPIICAQTFEEIPKEIQNCYVMYEPETAISTPGNFHPENIERVKQTIANWKEKFDFSVEFLYGGSINSENAKNYASIPDINGLVIGQASTDPESFLAIINSIS